MPVLTLYPHGFTVGCAPGGKPPTPPERTECAGWTTGAIRRNKLFLYSVDQTKLDGVGFALSLTLKICPETHEDWRRVLVAFFKRLRRLDLIRGHWVVEWQKRGVPHLHMAVWFPAEVVAPWGSNFHQNLTAHWIELTNEPYQAQPGAQHVTPIYDALGWNQYTSKHASRGLSNYQRNPASIPKGWRELGTGRMWGKIGDWSGVCAEPTRVDMPFGAYTLLRRITRGYCMAKARLALGKARDIHQGKLARRRVTWTRRMLRCTDPKLSAVRGLNEWMPIAEQFRAMVHLAALGFELES